eukprot:Opistho-2@19269
MGTGASKQQQPTSTVEVLETMLRDKEGVTEVMTSCDPVVRLGHGSIHKKKGVEGEYFYYPNRLPNDVVTSTDEGYRPGDPILSIVGPGQNIYFLEKEARLTSIVEKPKGVEVKKPAGRGFVWPKYFYDANGNLPREAIRILRFDVVSFEAVAAQPVAPDVSDRGDDDDFEDFDDDEYDDDDVYATSDGESDDSDSDSALSDSRPITPSARAPSAAGTVASAPSGISRSGKTMNRKRVTIVVKMTDTVARVKDKLQVVYLVPQSTMELYAGPVLLSNDRIVSESMNISSGQAPADTTAAKARVCLAMSVTNEPAVTGTSAPAEKAPKPT